MSDILLPSMPGLMWSPKKAPEFNTSVQRSVNLSELRASYAATPVWHFTQGYEVLRQYAPLSGAAYTELEDLCGFFLARYGRFDSWLFADPYDSVALLEPFGVGDGVTTVFQLARKLGPFYEAVTNIAASPAIYKGGVLQTLTTNYTIDATTKRVTFTAAPGNGVVVAWSGTYYFRCRFKYDATEFENFMRDLYSARQFEFIGSLGRKI
jgi:uncharacterized protein (TIGR02217 family)